MILLHLVDKTEPGAMQAGFWQVRLPPQQPHKNRLKREFGPIPSPPVPPSNAVEEYRLLVFCRKLIEEEPPILIEEEPPFLIEEETSCRDELKLDRCRASDEA